MFASSWKFRLLAGMMLGLALGWAGPSLTTVQDTLYKADGTPFNGFLLIEWTSFEAADTSNIATHNVTASIINGVLSVKLVPNTTGSSYSVLYSSDGKIQFQETWVVTSSATPLRLKDVRAAVVPGGSELPPPNESSEIQESDVVGLVNDLAIRPVQGPNYAPSRAAYIDPSGMLEAVVGNLDDCVRVDGSAGPCGSATGTSPGFVDGETPAGLINGSNAVFTLADTPLPATSLAVYRNGLLQKPDTDYQLVGNVITFLAGAIPQPGDSLTAGYRLIDPGSPAGQAGGALTGTYPNPVLGAGVVSDANVYDMAGIKESKLALNYPTHSNMNDPSADEKAALVGTAGHPAAANKFVTDQDPRLSDSRAPAGHSLLSAAHTDTASASPSRGDLIVGQGTSPALWTRLAIGPANRCLMSNGSDAVWNTCLYTAFPAGSVPFADASGNLAQNSTRLTWDNTNRRLSVGNGSAAATLYIWDSLASTGSTGLAVRAGQGQGNDPLTRWLDASGGELTRVESDGRIAAPSFHGATSATRAAWQDAGNAADPSSRSDGDAWFNTSAAARKTAEGGQVHTSPQVLCSSTGTGTSSTGLVQLASCTIPAGFLKAGDRVDIRFDYSHEGSSVDFVFEVRWGATPLVSRGVLSSETAVTGKADAGIYSGGAQWSLQSWGAGLALAASTGSASDSVSAPLTVSFLGRMASATAETVTLRNMTVIRYPAQQNP
jgi:hypothetical protein